MARSRKNQPGRLLGSHTLSRDAGCDVVEDVLTEGVESIILGDERLSMLRKTSPAAAVRLESRIRLMWRAFETGRMDFSYAEAGRVYGGGMTVYDYDDLTELLLEYGFSQQEAFQFIDEFSESCSLVDGAPRIVSVSARRARMMSEVEALPENRGLDASK